jgi:4-coumarate--CoA ligase
MPYKSQSQWEPLHSSVPTFLFGSPVAAMASTEPLIIDPKRPKTHYLTLHTFREWSKRFASGLVAAGFEPGDRVTLFSGNDLFTPVVVIGIIMAGGIYNSANPAYTPRELAHQLKDCEPRFILAAGNCLDRAREGAELAGICQERVFLFESFQPEASDKISQKPTAGNHWCSLISTPELGKDFRWEELDSPNLSSRTAILVYSSGTTGLPKGVEISHFNLVSNTRQLLQVQFTSEPSRRRALCCLPMYHGLGLVYYTIVAPKAGIQVFLMERYKLSELLDHIQRFKITELLLVPPILLAISKDPGVQKGKYNLDSIQKVVAGAAPLGIEVSQEFEKIWSGRIKVRQAWGMSELVLNFHL